MTTTKQDAATLLENAADAIDTYGWVQHDLGHPNRGFCAVGAVLYAHDPVEYLTHGGIGGNVPRQVWDHLNRAARKQGHGPRDFQSAVVMFNNHHATTQGDVTDLLRGVAKDLRNAA